jgi:hypothetical protein
MHVDYAVFIARASEPVVSKHLWASNRPNHGQVWWRPWERPKIAIEEVVKFETTATASAITYFNNGYSEFEHTRPAVLGTRTAMNADKINI